MVRRREVDPVSQGQIVTFYSFKGGVGRTMALANVAFLAALNGYRVLAMDWDLEAPGLAYYFRCLLDAPEVRALKERHGVMDVLAEWNRSTADSDTQTVDLDTLLARFQAGEPFAECVMPLFKEEQRKKYGGTLDFIGAGSRKNSASGLSYEHALAQFSWPAFFENHAGGLVLNGFRRWAKRNYDFVFLDSRTGLADVAGICTTQIPDKVALCFVLNRQNIDGVARVASSIRHQSEDKVILRAVPMRLSAKDTSEASDAQARAISELTRVGGFSSDAAREDIRSLSIASAGNVPYYETLMAFAAENSALDPLTLNYALLGSNLLEVQLQSIQLDPVWVEQARHRLQPRHATIEYVTGLSSAEPGRVLTELQRLIANASEAVMDGVELDADYPRALVTAGQSIEPFVEDDEGLELHSRTLDLLRALATNAPTMWEPELAAYLDRYIEDYAFRLEENEALEILEELDALLTSNPTIEGQIKRVENRLRIAEQRLVAGDLDSVLQVNAGVRRLVKKIEAEDVLLAADQAIALRRAEIRTFLINGEALSHKKRPDDAAHEFQRGIRKLPKNSPFENLPEFDQLASLMYLRLAITESTLDSPESAAAHAVLAMKRGGRSNLGGRNFLQLARIALSSANQPKVSLDFCEAAFERENSYRKSRIISSFVRNPPLAAVFFDTIGELVSLIGYADERAQLIMEGLVIAAEAVLAASRIRSKSLNNEVSTQFDHAASKVSQLIREQGYPLGNFPHLYALTKQGASRRQRGL
jgi:hypothetical protein